MDASAEQLTALEEENRRLFEALVERDREFEALKASASPASPHVNGAALDEASLEIERLARQLRNATAKASRERALREQWEKRAKDLEAQLKAAQQTQAKAAEQQQKGHRDELEVENQRLMKKNASLGVQLSRLQAELATARTVLRRELGDDSLVERILNGGPGEGWRGRAEQIQRLQLRLKKLQARMGVSGSALESEIGTPRGLYENSLPDIGDSPTTRGPASGLSMKQGAYANVNIAALNMAAASGANGLGAGGPAATAKNRLAELADENEDLRQRLDSSEAAAAKASARSAALQRQIHTLQTRLEEVVEKTEHDNELIDVLLAKAGVMKGMQAKDVVMADSALIGRLQSEIARLNAIIQRNNTPAPRSAVETRSVSVNTDAVPSVSPGPTELGQQSRTSPRSQRIVQSTTETSESKSVAPGTGAVEPTPSSEGRLNVTSLSPTPPPHPPSRTNTSEQSVQPQLFSSTPHEVQNFEVVARFYQDEARMWRAQYDRLRERLKRSGDDQGALEGQLRQEIVALRRRLDEVATTL